jgi:predicted dehydrogenase
MKFGVGVIGATGFIGTPYRAEIREATDEATIIALCARRRDLLEAAGEEDGASLITSDWREVVDHPDVDLIVVATPDALHHEEVMAAVEKGKHVFCDKPVAMNVVEAYQMWTACRDAGLGHYVPFWTRYVACFVRAKEIVESGMLGEIRGIVCRWHNNRPASVPFTWRDNAELSSAGSVGDVGSHAYDTVRWITGYEAKRVTAFAGTFSPSKPDLGEPNLTEAILWGETHSKADGQGTRTATALDFGSIAIEFENGAVGSIMASHVPFLRKGLAPDMEIHGTEASLAINRLKNELTIARTGPDAELLEKIDDPGMGNRFSRFVFPALRERTGGGASEHPGLDDGWRAQMLIDAAVLSAKQGRSVELAELNAEA